MNNLGIIEIANKKRSNNTDFIVLIDPEFSIKIFEICIATLKRVDIALKRNGLENNIEDLIASFASYIKSINDQIRG